MSGPRETQRCRTCKSLKRNQVNYCARRGMALRDGYVNRANSCLFYERRSQAEYDGSRRDAVLAEKTLYEKRVKGDWS